MKIGIYGGTFNPPHLGHMAAAKAAVAALKLDKLLLIPAAIPPHKALPSDTPAPEHRLAMVEKWAAGMGAGVEVSALELEREGKSYTSDTLRSIRQTYPDADLWHEPEVILSLAGICAFGRTEQDGEAMFAPQRDYLQQHFHAKITTITLPGLVDISSTRLREQLENGGGGQYLLPSVYGYILMHRLYGTKADLKNLDLNQLRACSYSMMRAKRIPHVMGVEEEAVKLAQRWGADPELARRAGILHDCTKYYELPEQLDICEEYGVRLDALEQKAVKLLHSKTGACIARGVFGQPDAVYDAIFWHTTGKADMTTLEKVLYIADYMEPNRDFDGVERLRHLAYTDLDKAMLLGVEMTIQEMQQRQVPIHTNTLQARDWLRQHGVTTED